MPILKLLDLCAAPSCALFFRHFLKWQKHFPPLKYCITMGLTSQNEQFSARCVCRASRGRVIERHMRVSGVSGLRCILTWATATETSLHVCVYVQSAGVKGDAVRNERMGKLAHFLCHCTKYSLTLCLAWWQPLSALICLINMHTNVPILWLNSSDSL